MDIGVQLTEAAQRLSVICDAAISVLEGKTIVAHATNPLNYAWPHHEQYLLKWGSRGGHTLLLGMNPGPWGMAQTGVPFGATEVAQSFLQIEARKLETPPNAHPKRPIEGMALERQEVSGTRLWNLMEAHFGSVEATFDNIFVVNHCPLLLLGETGKNITPNNLPASVISPLLKACDEHLLDVIDIMGVTRVVGIGKYAEQRARMALGAKKSGMGMSRDGRSIRIDTCWHPSPASPLANRNDGADWRSNVITCLQN